jgi:Interferon-induced transmembrane protein/zinc-ribbon domain
MYCVHCGAANPDNAQRCAACGRELVEIAVGGTTPPHPPTPTEKIPTYLAPAILTTLCCGCPPFGIVAIVYASRVDGKLAAGDVEGAKQASRSAKMWCWITFGISVLGFAACLLFSIICQMMN